MSDEQADKRAWPSLPKRQPRSPGSAATPPNDEAPSVNPETAPNPTRPTGAAQPHPEVKPTVTERAKRALGDSGEEPEKTSDKLKKVGSELAQGAAKGAAQGAAGGAVGAGVGAVKGAAVAAVKNRTVRRWIYVTVALLLITFIVVPAALIGSASNVTSAIVDDDDQNAYQAASEAGLTRDDINQYRQMSLAGEVPWTIIAALHRKTGSLDEQKLTDAIRAADPSGTNRDITRGSVYDFNTQTRKIATDEISAKRQSDVKAVYIDALMRYGLDRASAENVYKTALAWALGNSMACGVTSQSAVVDDFVMDAEQEANAQTILGVAKSMFPSEQQRRAAIIALATARQESGLRSIDYGDQAGPDSRGLFQQRDSWGPLELRMNPAGAAGLFYKRLTTVAGWQTMSLGEAAWQVQRFQENLKAKYDQYEAWATAWVDLHLATAIAVIPPAEVEAAIIPAGTTLVSTGCPINATSGWVYPLDLGSTSVKITDFYNWRKGIAGAAPFHAGIDLSAPGGTPIMAVQAGTVEFAGPRGTLGNSIILAHPDGSRTQYSHIRDGGLLVKEGDTVTTGQIIGQVGSTGGISNGNHLDFRAYLPGTAGSISGAVTDPVLYMLERGVDFRVIPIDYANLTTEPTF